MKDHRLITAVLLASALSTHAQQPTPIAPAPVLPGAVAARPAYSLTTSKDWQNPAALREKLGKKIQERLKGTDEAALKAFLSSEFNRLLLANWYLANAEICSEEAYTQYTANLTKKLDTKKKELENKNKELPELSESAQVSTQYTIDKLKGEIAELEAELKQPVRLADVVKRPRASRLINLIANDLGWIGDVVYSGECIMPGRILNMLANMMERYTRMLPNERLPRDVATATALEFSRFEWTVDNACKRAEYFVRNWRQDRLHPQFDTLPFWQRRVVCGWKGDHASGTPESFEWALYNVNLPDERHTGSCWRCGYVLNNVYGDSVHGSAYYNAFEGLYIGQHHKFTQEVGGVCGGLSHFGASAACAHGIPGLTMGEPAHCAYVVWVDGKWTPAYSVGWERGLHWRPWLDNWRYSSLHMLTELMSPQQKQATRLSNAYRVLAQMQSSKGNTDAACELFLKAQAAQPRNYEAFRDHSRLLLASKAGSEAWLKLHDSLSTHMVPVFAECAAELCNNVVCDNLLKSGTPAEQMKAAFAGFWKNTRDIGPERWKLQDLIDKQIKMLNTRGTNSDADNKCAVFSSVIKSTIANPAYATYALESGNTLMNRMDVEGKARMLSIMTEAISSDQNMSVEARTKALAKAILSAEALREADTFQAVSKMVPAETAHMNRPIGDFDPFPGKLVSEGGVVFASSTSQWDWPATHANVLTSLGGQIHTHRNKNPWIAVKLPKYATISGVVLAANPDNANWHRLNNLQIQVSETGKDDDWHNVGQPTGNCTQRLIRVDLTAEQPKALFIRVIRPDVQEFLHFDGIFVFGTPAA